MGRKQVARAAKREDPHPEPAERPRSPLYRGYSKATFSLRRDQLERLRDEARRRAESAGVFRPDASEVLREAIDLWVELRAQRRR